MRDGRVEGAHGRRRSLPEHPRRARAGRLIAPLALAPVLAGPGVALAQEERCLPLRVAELRDAMDAVESALAAGDGALAARVLDDAREVVRCLDERLEPSDLGRLARQHSVVGFYAQDDVEVRRWALLARETLGAAPWPESLVVPPHYHQLVASYADPQRSGPEGRGLAPPRRGALLYDGRMLLEPSVAVDVPHLVQRFDRRGRVVDTRWQDGAAFPEELLGPPGAPDVPRWYARAEVAPPVPTPPSEPAAEPGASEPDPSVPPPAIVTFDLIRSARECPWRGVPKRVEASNRSVRIGRRQFPIRSAEDRLEFKQVLRSCGELRAARRFTRWMESRRKVFRFDGRKQKQKMIEALQTIEPGERPR